MTLRLAPLAVACALATRLAAQDAPHPTDPFDTATYRLVVRAPGMDEARAQEDLVYDTANGLKFDLFTPKSPAAALPVVVFANGVGEFPGMRSLKDWAIYEDWARYTAARGMAGVTMNARGADPAADLAALIAHLRSNAAKYGLDPDRVGVYACSANVAPTLPLLMAHPPEGVVAAVMSYGIAAVPEIDAHLAVMHIGVGGDGPGFAVEAKALWARVVDARAPWTMIYAPTLPHAFDALDRSPESLSLTRRIGDFFVARLLARDPPLDEDAEPLAERAMRLGYGADRAAAGRAWLAVFDADPKQTQARLRAAECFVMARDFRGALPLLEDAVEAGESDPGALRDLARCLAATGREQDGVPWLERVVAAQPDDALAMTMLGHAALTRSDADAGIRWYERAFAAGLPPGAGGQGIAAWNLACAYARKERLDDAFAQLDRALEQGFGTGHDLETDADLAPLRGDARWAELLRRAPRSR